MHTKTISMFLGALLSTGVVLAQAPDQSQPANAPQATQSENARPHHAINPDKQARRLGKKLGLSSEQVAQIKPVLKDRAQQMQALRADTTMTPQDRRAKAHGIMQHTNTKIATHTNDTNNPQYHQLLT